MTNKQPPDITEDWNVAQVTPGHHLDGRIAAIVCFLARMAASADYEELIEGLEAENEDKDTSET